MRGGADLPPSVSFLPAPAGRRLFAVLFEAPDVPPRRPVLYLPPFAEEMNRTRRMAALAARELAANGHSTLFVDATGTGDSSGDFGSATWDIWIEDFTFAARWLAQKKGAEPVLLAARAGALLAPALLSSGAVAGDLLALWQPVLSGKQFLTQFLRLRVAAEMSSGGAQEGGTRALREQLGRGEGVEIAGYELNAGLALGLEAAALGAADLSRVRQLAWFETGASTASLLPASSRVLEAVRGGGAAVTAAAFAEPPYWTTPETSVAPGVIAATRDFFAQAA